MSKQDSRSGADALGHKAHELVQAWQTGRATPEDMLLTMLACQKLARSSRRSFQEHWPTAIRIAQDLTQSTSAPSPIRAAASALLSFDCFCRLDWAKAAEIGRNALDGENQTAQYVLLVCQHLAQRGMQPNKEGLKALMDEIDRCLCGSVNIERQIALHQCYLFALHLGLLHGQADLTALAEQYIARLKAGSR